MTPDHLTAARRPPGRGAGRLDSGMTTVVDIVVHDDAGDAALLTARDGAASAVAAVAALLLGLGILLGIHGCGSAALLCDSLSLTAVVTAGAAAFTTR